MNDSRGGPGVSVVPIDDFEPFLSDEGTHLLTLSDNLIQTIK